MTPRPRPLLLLALALTAAARASYTVQADFADRPRTRSQEAGKARRAAARRGCDLRLRRQLLLGRRRVGGICDAHRRPGAVAPDHPREPPASPRAVRLLRPGQPRRILGRTVRRGVLRRPRPDADRRDPRTDPRAPGRLGPLI